MSLNNEARPSKLELDRYATDELTPSERHALEARLDDRAREHLVALEATRGQVPPLDLGALRERARAQAAREDAAGSLPEQAIAHTAPPAPAAANNTRGWWIGGSGLIAIAAAALLWLSVGPLPGPDREILTARSGSTLIVHQARDGQLTHYDAGTPVGEGDTLGFQVHAGDHHSVVLLSVDGTGSVTVFFGSEQALPLDDEGLVPLPGTVVLDGAPGPEIFVAVFDTATPDAIDLVKRSFSSGGHAGLLSLARSEPRVDAVEITRD